MAVIDSLQAAYANVAAQLAALTASPKPSYSIDGESVSWGEHFNSLTDRLATLKRAIQDEGGPFELRSRGVT